MRVFQSSLVKNRKTQMIEVPDAALERIQTLQGKQKDAKARGDIEGAKRIGDLLQKYNLDNNHYVNAIDEQGNIGILKLRHRAKGALDATIKALREQGVDPLSVDNGRFFTFRRSGTGLDTQFTVGVKQRELMIEGVGKVKQDIVHVLTDEILNRLEKEAAELDKLYKRPSASEVEKIVQTSDLLSGKSSAIDELFDAKNDNNPSSNDEGADTEYGTEEPSASVVSTTTQAKQTTTSTAQPAAPVTTQTQSAPVQSAPQATASVSVAPTSNTGAPKTTAQTVSEMTDDDFLKSLGL